MSKSTRKDTVRWMDWYWNKGGREKCLTRRSTKEYRIKEKIARIKRETAQS